MENCRPFDVGSITSIFKSTLRNPAFDRGIDLFNREHFFDAHESLEDVWRSVPRESEALRDFRRHLQGLVQIAVAFHHQSTGNYVGALSVLKRALRNLDGADTSFPDLDLVRLRTELTLWREFLPLARVELDDGDKNKSGNRQNAPPLPKIVRRLQG